MIHIWFLVFISKLAFILAVFDSNKIISELEESDLLTWKIKENFFQDVVIEKVHDKPEKINFDLNNAYIVLKKVEIVKESESTMQYTIYYLVSGETSMNKRYKTVEYVIELRNVLSINQEKLKFKDEISVIRETYNQESLRFKVIFSQTWKNLKSVPPQRLYSVSKINEEIHLQQVSLHFSELNRSQAFVYDNSPSVTIFNVGSEIIDQDVVSAAQKIGLFINFENIHKKICNKLSLRNCLNWSPKNDDCYSKFLEKLEECPGKHIIIDKMLENEAKKIPITSDYKLYLPAETEAKFLKREFIIENRGTFDSMTEACYVFVMQKVKEVFIYIRDFTNNKHVEKCLKYGEKFTAESKYLVSVFQKAYPSTPFIFIFKKLRPFILDRNIGDSRFQSIIKDIATELP